MSLYEQILKDIDAHYGPKSRSEFLDRLETEGYVQLLRHNPATRSFQNATPQEKTLEVKIDFSDIGTLDEAFDVFCSLTQNTITIDDYRLDRDYFARLYNHPSYFLFHGDGFCSSLGFLFQGFAKKLLNLDLSLKYCRTPDGAYTHVYGMFGDRIYDPALKSRYPVAELENHIPAAWFYTLLKRVGMKRFFELAQADLEKLFSPGILKHLEIMNSGNFQTVYRSDAELAKVFEVFKNAVVHHTQDISVTRDDFAWKKEFREAVDKFWEKSAANEVSQPYFLNLIQTDNLISWKIPARSTLTCAAPSEGDALLQWLEYVFFGRRFCLLDVELKAGEEKVITFPDIPWFARSPSLAKISSQQQILNSHKIEKEKKYFYFSNAAIRSQLKFLKGNEYQLQLRSEENGIFQLVFPVNTLVLDSPRVQFKFGEN